MKDLSNDVEYMKEYLKHALEMEVHKYTWEEALEDVKNKRDENEALQASLKSVKQKASSSLSSIDEVYEKKKTVAKENAKAAGSGRFTLLILSPVLFIFGLLLMKGDAEISYMMCFPGAIGCIVGFLILTKRASDSRKVNSDDILNNEKSSTINSLTSSKAQAEYNLDLANKKELRLVSSQQKIYAELKEARANLEKIYSNNVLPMKYRNLASVATLYEYLENRRCNTISGPGGIYDTYAHDQQLGAINENLNDIKYAVYKVYEAQSYLYEELSNANEHLKDIKKEIGSIRQSSDIAAENSAISAEASRQSADMLNWFNWTRKF